MNKKIAIVIVIMILLIIAIGVFSNINQKDVEGERTEVNTELKNGEEIEVVPTMRDTISKNSSWCGTFQLVWNDMKNEIVKQDVIFSPQEEMAENLNKEDFTADMISDEYYYKIYGLKTLALKQEIEEGIKKKFNQESDILDKFDWSDSALNDENNLEVSRYFFYTMLYRNFEFLKEFDNLENDLFGKQYENIAYFGIDENTDNKVGNQMEVLYYYSKDDFAILINTKSDDEVIFCKKPEGSNFKAIYDNMIENANKYDGDKNFKNSDEFKAPKINFDVLREYEELENKIFKTESGIGQIEKALQTIKFKLDEKGGTIKSEAAIDMKVTSAMIPSQTIEEPRYFYVDDTFTIFLREKGRDVPYFAGRIDDITKFQ